MDIIITGNKNIVDAIAAKASKKPRNAKGTKGDEKPSAQEAFVPSIFRYVQPTPNGALVYQTLTNAFVRLTKMELEKLEGRRPIGKALAKQLAAQGLFVPAGLDERKGYCDMARTMRKRPRPYLSLNITTTLACNARCTYCYEKGVPQRAFDRSMIPKLLAFLRDHLPKDGTLRINWFGGEPLLGTEIIDEITTALTKEGVAFSSYIITNGSRLTKRLIDQKFQRWNVGDVQITLDGLAKTYEARKQYQDQKAGIFSRILKKIETVAHAGVNVHIRLNIDRGNMEEVLELIELLEKRYGTLDKVTWYPAFLTGIGSDLTCDEKIAFVRKMFERMKNPTKMNVAQRMFAMPRIMSCMRYDQQSYSIDVSGRVYRCEHEVGREEFAIGRLSPFSFDDRGRTTIRLSKECKECVFLPKCLGGCASDKAAGDAPCLIERYMIQGYLAFMAEKEGAVFDEEARNAESDPASGESSGETVRNHRTTGTSHRNPRRRKPART
ncbi:radical SAM/SPASM domain-containing protein [uncultured Selenomonas sp.]|uniref:radical SAM/SPASM domain-containing protein n=1 Tax=uncultured Selenomonas sp. TaxID=159275 RepID=UPI0025D84DAF|nr:radical SAM protein [uncultured Selenomonas sp.]